MSAQAAVARSTVKARNPSPARTATADCVNLARRNLVKTVRTPRLVVFSCLQPVVTLAVLVYVFGGVIRVRGFRYVDYVTPAVVLETLALGVLSSGIALATDVRAGIVDRFRSLPTARSSVLVGRMVADFVRNGVQALLMLAAASLLGFRFHSTVLSAVPLLALSLAFAWALSCYSAFVAFSTRDPERSLTVLLATLAPLVFVSSAFVPVATLPGWLQPVARVNPVTPTADALRHLALGGPTAPAVLHAVVWTVAMAAVFLALAVHRYRRL